MNHSRDVGIAELKNSMSPYGADILRRKSAPEGEMRN